MTFRRARPLERRSPAGERSGSRSAPGHQRAWRGEAACGFRALFWRLCHRACPLHVGRWTRTPRHDHAPAHTALSARQFWAPAPTLPMRLASPGATLALLPRVGQRSADVEGIRQTDRQTDDSRSTNSTNTDDLSHCFEPWKKRLDRRRASKGERVGGG